MRMIYDINRRPILLLRHEDCRHCASVSVHQKAANTSLSQYVINSADGAPVAL